MSRFNRIVLAGALILSTAPSYAQSPAPTAATTVAPRLLGPSGVRREVGNWLFNDSIFVTEAPNVVPGAPTFLPSLRRDAKTKLPIFRTVATRGPLNFSTLALPSLREMSVSGYDFVALQGRLLAQVNTARAQGHVHVGWSLPTASSASSAPLNKEAAAAMVKRLRGVLDAVAPDSALILEVDTTNSLLAVADIDAVAPSCDAILLRADVFDAKQLWPLKMARRVVEEQKEFDLPLIVAPQTPDLTAPTARRQWDARLLEFFMGGATGFVLPDALVPSWEASTRLNPALFAGAVTLEDAAILPSPNPHTLEIAADLRAAGRVPLAGRLPSGDRAGEVLLVVLDNQTSLETLNGLDKAIRAGTAVYLEGMPNLTNKALMVKLSDMTGTNIEILPEPKTESLNLDDPWLFGSARGLEIPVVQRVKWTVKTSLADQTRTKKEELLLKPYAAAKLAMDANGILVSQVGKGRLTWLPHTLAPSRGDDTSRLAFYSAIAGSLQASLAEWKFASVEDETRNGRKLRLAMRASKAGTPVLAVFNDADSDATVAVSARSDAKLTLDLLTNQTLPTSVVGYASTVNIVVPAHGFRWLTYGQIAKDLDKERLAPRPKARTK